ncbi:hypothetical protein [Streptomyces sp. NBC_01233]|uniref:hypothetical protein n=1 Tax=Streptomyces sp. NBC_01233 TaxID=2903787 RepID=UPI002E103E4E|nr:hypothetical protein OG332_04725 [Streptomyces sp. NBC_01233]
MDRSGLPWHAATGGAVGEMAGAEPHTVVLAGYGDGDGTLCVDDGAGSPHAVAEAEFGTAWSGHRKGRGVGRPSAPPGRRTRTSSTSPGGPEAAAAGRRSLFDECAALVDRSPRLERQAVTLL